jgi:lipoprotein-anchoring transpeptidase ErfK/SrfK
MSDPLRRRRKAGRTLVAWSLVLLVLSPAATASTADDIAGQTRGHPGKKVVQRPAKSAQTQRFGLTNARIARWAAVMRPALVRASPKEAARTVTRLEMLTSDNTQNLVLVLGGIKLAGNKTWYRVRLPILPNNSTGWVRKSALSALYTVRTHLYVDRGRLTATLKRDGKTIFKTHVGLGRSAYPTPRGQFYIRDKLVGFSSPVYGPVAFGTSARSPVLTDWPGGGFVGVHGTNEPGILPGYVSHGCIRMPNEAILKLARLMPVGTPLTVT